MAIVATRQGRSSASGRRTLVRRHGTRLAAVQRPLAFVLGLMLASTLSITFSTPASAQFAYNKGPVRTVPPRPPSDGQMMVQAVEVDYDYNNSRVSAVGNVQMFYNGTSVEADKVIYDQKTKRLHAEGNIRMTDADGKITYANIMDLSDDYRDGFVDSLRVDTADNTRMAATRSDRSSGNYTVFENGVYTACAPCRDDPKKPPLWQVKGARIIHDQNEKMLYFENAQLEFFGVPMAYMPYFSTPDPTVKRKTGFLMPSFTSYTPFGYGMDVPFYWAIAPDYDATFIPRITTRQGVLMQAEFRQRLINGSYQIRAYGIDQLDPGAFAGQPGDRQFRGGIDTRGQFALNDKWVWGWDGVLLSDYYFLSDYRLAQYRDPMGSFLSLPTDAVSQLYLTGVGNRSYFDARTIYYLSFSGNQSQVPVVAPVIDYSNVVNYNVLGGEFSYKGNFTSLTRDTAAFDAITATAFANGSCLPTTADPPRTSPGPIVCCAACPAPTRARRAKWIGDVHLRTPRAKSGRRSRASAPTRSTVRWRTSRAFRTSFPLARARRCERCRRSASNIVTPSSTFSRGEPRRSSRSRRSLPVPTNPMPASFPMKMRRAWCSTPATCLVSTNSPAMTASRAAAAPMPAYRRPRNSIMVEPSLRCSGSPISYSA